MALMVSVNVCLLGGTQTALKLLSSSTVNELRCIAEVKLQLLPHRIIATLAHNERPLKGTQQLAELVVGTPPIIVNAVTDRCDVVRLKEHGHTLLNLRNAGFSFTDLNRAGFTLDDVSASDVEYTLRELQDAGYGNACDVLFGLMAISEVANGLTPFQARVLKFVGDDDFQIGRHLTVDFPSLARGSYRIVKHGICTSALDTRLYVEPADS